MSEQQEAPQQVLCPDKGACHHGCNAGCWRVIASGPLSGVYPDDKWPQEMVTEHTMARYPSLRKQEDPGILRTLHDAVKKVLEERYGPLWGMLPAPEGLRLEMHPKVRSAMLRDHLAWGMTERQVTSEFRVPVRVTTDLPEGRWRLVIVTEDVLGGGQL